MGVPSNLDQEIMKPPVKVVVTGATGSIGYNLLFRIASGSMLGPNQPIHLSLFNRDRPGAMDTLIGVTMELNDSWFPLLHRVDRSTDLDEAFGDADIVCLVGSVPRGPGMERGDLLLKNGEIFVEQGKALDRSAKKTCKTVVVGNPANTNALIAMSQCKNIPHENFSALTRLDHNRLVFQIARKAGVQPTQVQRACIWGNHSPTMYPDVRFCEIDGRPIKEVIDDHEWLETELVTAVQQRGREIIDRRQQSSSASAASATADHMRDWFQTGSNGWTSMAVMAGDNYGIGADIIFSYPVITFQGRWNKVGDLPIDEKAEQMLLKTKQELVEERDAVKSLLGN